MHVTRELRHGIPQIYFMHLNTFLLKICVFLTQELPILVIKEQHFHTYQPPARRLVSVASTLTLTHRRQCSLAFVSNEWAALAVKWPHSQIWHRSSLPTMRAHSSFDWALPWDCSRRYSLVCGSGREPIRRLGMEWTIGLLFLP
jgi:hypothetical protein